jgi:probable phosphoglycerate mutase
MTRILLIRHAATATVGRQLAGRTEDAALSSAGSAHARRLARALSAEKIASVYTSPRQRARQTADLLAASWRTRAACVPELDEVDYGEWSGRTIEELRGVGRWQAFNTIRSCTSIPNGELMIAVQARIVAFLQSLRERHPVESVAVITHAEVIRAALVYYLGAPLDVMLRLEVSPGSVSVLQIDESGPSVLCVNWAEELHQT